MERFAIVAGITVYIIAECMNQWREQTKFDLWRKDHEWFMDCAKTDRMERGIQ